MVSLNAFASLWSKYYLLVLKLIQWHMRWNYREWESTSKLMSDLESHLLTLQVEAITMVRPSLRTDLSPVPAILQEEWTYPRALPFFFSSSKE
mmetsp:Transcript_5644/g.11542  ORF Transcript_5644/g.11542 Transcript_5644/m.11542 type:complete len:93 (-) Transcript_5644:259-537(-)